MPRQVVHAVNLRYVGQPTINVNIDGNSIVTSQQLPSHSVLRTRRIELPPGMVGNIPQLQTPFTEPLEVQFESVPEETYANQQLFHFFEVQFTGTVEVQLYVDQVLKQPNDSDEQSVTLSVRSSRQQDTRRVYFPPLTYGWVPQLKQVVNPTQDGQVLSSRIKSLPARFSRGEKEHSEIQVTHQGEVYLKVFMDGQEVDSYRMDADRYDADSFITTKNYLPSGTRGHVLQWMQTTGNGEIALFETDTTLTDREQPQVEA